MSPNKIVMLSKNKYSIVNVHCLFFVAKIWVSVRYHDDAFYNILPGEKVVLENGETAKSGTAKVGQGCHCPWGKIKHLYYAKSLPSVISFSSFLKLYICHLI